MTFSISDTNFLRITKAMPIISIQITNQIARSRLVQVRDLHTAIIANGHLSCEFHVTNCSVTTGKYFKILRICNWGKGHNIFGFYEITILEGNFFRRIYICGSSIVCFDESMILYSESYHNRTKGREFSSE